MSLSPIVLFVYNRPNHTRRTIEALGKNRLASDSELYIYSDFPKTDNARHEVEEVRLFLHSMDEKLFKKVTIIERTRNWGLADSIIDGVSSLVNVHGRIIVLEDDLVTSPYFLTYMNEALDFYENRKKVWHISGWNYPIANAMGDNFFLWRLMNCWGWGTWKDRWCGFEKDAEKLINSLDEKSIFSFNLDGVADFWEHVQLNKEGRMNTWAVFWYANIFQGGGLCLNPRQTYVQNIGFDGSGEHCSGGIKEDNLCLQTVDFVFPEMLVESSEGFSLARRHVKKRVHHRMKSMVRKISIFLYRYFKRWWSCLSRVR